MKPSTRCATPTQAASAVILSLLAALAAPARAQGFPGEPSEAELDAALAAHHDEVLRGGLAEGSMVWFIVDAEKQILETGVDEAEGLEDTLRARYPETTSEFALEFDHITVSGRTVPILWMLPGPAD